jgi:hypothetical protein
MKNVSKIERAIFNELFKEKNVLVFNFEKGLTLECNASDLQYQLLVTIPSFIKENNVNLVSILKKSSQGTETLFNLSF